MPFLGRPFSSCQPPLHAYGKGMRHVILWLLTRTFCAFSMFFPLSSVIVHYRPCCFLRGVLIFILPQKTRDFPTRNPNPLAFASIPQISRKKPKTKTKNGKKNNIFIHLFLFSICPVLNSFIAPLHVIYYVFVIHRYFMEKEWRKTRPQEMKYLLHCQACRQRVAGGQWLPLTREFSTVQLGNSPVFLAMYPFIFGKNIL